VTNLGDWALVFPVIAFSCLIGIAYVLGKQHGGDEERRREAVRKAHQEYLVKRAKELASRQPYWRSEQ